ncbi:NAD(P)-binding domain-containing protein [Methylocystis sp. MJC1]|jgi:thioredoxin reductase/ferredoxin|uniref:NAD(P)-binding domain-containing protein n=1 Tax=Methylocystis sp. MJC1 TaxID=2654282 RepID=UPI0013EC2276|nr:NAD(P)-binding domain-containing protein [Methylocystis sp. MJC1]KAF2988854.1 Ferredoxin--NADP reductase [Methylocystis sp. MJC1]MBU6526398.1 NAD(P)-binding domain-containing protein [Methylocystis sp. MJC1]UZX12846.1 NAD(P)-binding domain-containing protein [Methylocystis sp. MJC1]
MQIDMIFAYALPLMVIWSIYLPVRKRLELRAVEKLAAATDAGLLEPASLHPIIDPARCIGCGSCVRACHEGEILGLIDGRSTLVEPANCIGHGMCKAVCPVDAITLVFGTDRRGVDIPNVSPNFETNVPGIFIAGELGGMGLVRNAIEQGRQAIDSISKLNGLGAPDMLDVVIVGCGPGGFSASLAALQHKLRFVTLEQDTLGGTVAHFPRGKLVMTQPFTLPLAGTFDFGELSKEELIAFFEDIVIKTGLKVNTGERVDSIARVDGHFEVKSTQGSYKTRSVLLTIGRRGTPRRLDVPGEEQPKVVYRMIDPEQYRGQHVLVVGGGDSALEAACEIAEQPGTVVTLSHRSESFGRAKQKNRERIKQAQQAGRVEVIFSSTVESIGVRDVNLKWNGEQRSFANDAVIVCVGGILPMPFLKSIGIEVETKYGTA